MGPGWAGGSKRQQPFSPHNVGSVGHVGGSQPWKWLLLCFREVWFDFTASSRSHKAWGDPDHTSSIGSWWMGSDRSRKCKINQSWTMRGLPQMYPFTKSLFLCVGQDLCPESAHWETGLARCISSISMQDCISTGGLKPGTGQRFSESASTRHVRKLCDAWAFSAPGLWGWWRLPHFRGGKWAREAHLVGKQESWHSDS